jgi:pimeloyl-ACP methyl ester carboxylesterase
LSGIKNLALAVAAIAHLAAASGCNAVRLNNKMLQGRFHRAGMVESWAELPSGKMRYFVGGDGPPLLLLHGFGFGAVENWSRQVKVFTKRFRVYAPDLFWFGASVPRAPIETTPAEAETVRELLDALHLPRADVVGASYGGLVALHLALNHADRIDRLVLVDAPGLHPNTDEETVIADDFHGETRVEPLLLPDDVAHLSYFLERVVYGRPPPLPGWILRQVLAELHRNREPKAKLARGLDGPDLLDVARLGRVRNKTLVIWGRNDPLLLPSIGARMAAAIPGAKLVIIPGASHSAMMEQPERFNELVLGFLQR